MKKPVVVRIAPSPTGNLHVGTARTALFNYLFAKKHDGIFHLRIEDTDRERSTKEFENEIIESLSWLSLEWHSLVRQSERTELYKKYLQKMIADGTAYVSKEEEGARAEVIRFKNPNKVLHFNDLIRGDISFDTTELEDFVIAKDLDTPLYHLAVVVDDIEMGITHIIRGEDHISNTPRQILIIEALGKDRPAYAHIPLILAPDRSKLSKRHGATSLSDYKSRGYLPEAMTNFMALLGWSPQGVGENEELFSLEELTRLFDLDKVGKSGAIFNLEKLDWVNQAYVRKMSPEAFLSHSEAFIPEDIKAIPGSEKILEKLITILKERIVKFADIGELFTSGDLGYFFQAPLLDKHKIFWKKDPEGTLFKKELPHLVSLLEAISEEDFTKDHLETRVLAYLENKDRGSILWPVRYLLTGKEKSPDPFTVMSILGKEASLVRLQTIL